MGTNNHLLLYKNRMDEIVRRLEVAEAFIRREKDALYLQPHVECIYLQYRNILESIATASLSVNRDDMDESERNGRGKWRAGDILRAVETVNPDYYYPKPVKLVENDMAGRMPRYRGEWKDVPEEDYLTREDFNTLYDIANKVVHTANPFYVKSYKKDDKQCWKLISQAMNWHQKIINLLQHHLFKLVGDEDMLYLAHTVGEDGSRSFIVDTFQKVA